MKLEKCPFVLFPISHLSDLPNVSDPRSIAFQNEDDRIAEIIGRSNVATSAKINHSFLPPRPAQVHQTRRTTAGKRLAARACSAEGECGGPAVLPIEATARTWVPRWVRASQVDSDGPGGSHLCRKEDRPGALLANLIPLGVVGLQELLNQNTTNGMPSRSGKLSSHRLKGRSLNQGAGRAIPLQKL